MPDPILDYQSLPPSPTRRQRIAAALAHLSWIMLALATVATIIVIFLCPRKSLDPFALTIQELSEIEPLINLAGASFGVASLLMGNPWSFPAIIAHIAEASLCPSIGFA
jgi:hypothetical protein